MNSCRSTRFSVAAKMGISIVLIALVASFAAPSVRPKLPLDEFMNRKKVHSQMILEGLMNEDFDAIVLAGEKMKAMRSDKQWDRITTQDYARFSEEFQKRAQSFVDAGRRKNLDACMSGYIDCLRTCYDCHKYVRAYPYTKASLDSGSKAIGHDSGSKQ